MSDDLSFGTFDGQVRVVMLEVLGSLEVQLNVVLL